jgi:hypothetical protein
MTVNAGGSGSAGPLLDFLTILAGDGDTSLFLDIRWGGRAARMRRRFVPAANLQRAARLISGLAARDDVYVGVALRDGHAHGGRAAIKESHLAWVESDDPDTAERLAAFAHPPTMVVASGTPGHVQLYWLLDRRRPIAEVESANRRLAHALAGDPACADAARILRPPETLNHKHPPPHAVTLLVRRPHARFALALLAGELPDDPEPPVATSPLRARANVRTRLDRELLAVPAADYVRVLAGRSPNREGKVLCPFHSERDPSLQVYPDGGFYCFGSSCRKGGTIFDFAGQLWGIPPRGVGFLELRHRLADLFELTGERCP